MSLPEHNEDTVFIPLDQRIEPADALLLVEKELAVLETLKDGLSNPLVPPILKSITLANIRCNHLLHDTIEAQQKVIEDQQVRLEVLHDAVRGLVDSIRVILAVRSSDPNA
jgi:hypothetical protein